MTRREFLLLCALASMALVCIILMILFIDVKYIHIEDPFDFNRLVKGFLIDDPFSLSRASKATYHCESAMMFPFTFY